MTDRYDSTRSAWEAIWSSADVQTELQTVDYPRAQRLLAEYLPFLPSDAPILEAGSGLGAMVISLRRLGFPVIGVDYALNALRATAAYDPAIPLSAADVHALPFADNSLGAILSFGVLEHFEQGMQAALRESQRVLRRGGVLVLTIPYPNLLWRIAQWRRERQGRTLIDEDFYESTYGRDALLAQVTQAGFSIVKAVPTGEDYSLWSAHRLFRAEGYYRTNALAHWGGVIARHLAGWSLSHMTLVVARK